MLDTNIDDTMALKCADLAVVESGVRDGVNPNGEAGEIFSRKLTVTVLVVFVRASRNR